MSTLGGSAPQSPLGATPRPAPRRARALPSPFVAIVGYTLRACLPLKRWFGVVLPCVGALLFGLLATAIDEAPEEAFSAVAENGLFGLILPLTCLVIGDAVLGADVRAGTFQLTWLSPASFTTIAAGRWFGGWMVALVTLVPALVLAAALAGVADSAAGPMALAGAAGSAAYVSLFLMLGVLVRRSVVWALGVVLLGERLLGASLSGVAQLSPLWEAQQTFAGLWDYGDVYDLERSGMPAGWSAVARLTLITVVCLLVTVWRLAHMKPLSGDD